MSDAISRPPAHIPVMLEEVLAGMRLSAGQVYVDGTFGAGGYSRALLESCHCTVYAIDRDPSVQRFAAPLEAAFPGRFFLLLGNFSDMIGMLDGAGVTRVDGIVVDIGVSSMQLGSAERGFSFKHDGPLDMRMGESGETAADIVNHADETEIADILYRYGEERKSRWIAHAVVKARSETPITRTAQLAAIVRKVLGSGDGIDPATRTFQALRIKVNDELGELERVLSIAETLLRPGGRLVVVTFHSLEDRIVKQFFQSRSGETRGESRHLPQPGPSRVAAAGRLPTFFCPSRKPILASAAEAEVNPRARSAKLRAGIRTEAMS